MPVECSGAMTTDERLHHLSFLLTCSSLAIGCAVGDEPTTTSLPPMVNPTNADDTDDTGDDTVSPPEGSEGPGVTSDGADAPGTSDDAASGSTTDEPYGDTTGGVAPLCMGMAPPMVAQIGPICMQYVAHYNDCWNGGMQPPECVYFYEAYCEYSIANNTAMYGPDCGMAYEDLFVCLTQTSCQQLDDMLPDCLAQEEAIDELCYGM